MGPGRRDLQSLQQHDVACHLPRKGRVGDGLHTGAHQMIGRLFVISPACEAAVLKLGTMRRAVDVLPGNVGIALTESFYAAPGHAWPEALVFVDGNVGWLQLREVEWL